MRKCWYLKVKFKDWIEGRKVWYQCSEYMCDCVNKPFESKTECEAWISKLKEKYKDRIESITLHRIKRRITR